MHLAVLERVLLPVAAVPLFVVDVPVLVGLAQDLVQEDEEVAADVLADVVRRLALKLVHDEALELGDVLHRGSQQLIKTCIFFG